jgi:uncharacterized membrane protein YGL010W
MTSTLLIEYGTYHRDHRNRTMHEIGIPLIVLAIVALLERVHLGPVDLAALAIVLTVAFYLRIDVPSALAAFIGYAALYAIGAFVPWWLAIALFIAGWIFQFAGHVYEGRKPAFLTNLVHLLVGPLWIAALAMRRVS